MATFPHRAQVPPRSLIVVLVLALLAVSGAVGMARPATVYMVTPSTAAERADLAQWWAPVHFQDVDTSGETSLGGKSDYLTSYDFDGDPNGRNNWENTSEYPLAAHVYYSVVQTPSFSYLLDMFFHPRDWADASLDDHMEDLSEIAKVDGVQDKYDSGDGVLYYPGSTAEVLEGPNDRDVQYPLSDVFALGGMWVNRNRTPLFATPDKFAGDDSGNPYGAACGEGGVAGPADGDCKTDAAHPPWAWDDEDDDPGKGYIATNPAELVHNYFDWPGRAESADLNYIWIAYNGYTWNAYNGVTPSDPAQPNDFDQQIAVASYIHPNATDSSGNPWDRLVASPSNKVSVVVANVVNGPGAKLNTDWKRVIDAAARSGKRVLGYVPTGYLGASTQHYPTRLGSPDLQDWVAQIEMDVDKWYELYGGAIGGIFFDEGFNECGTDNLYPEVYEQLNQYVKNKYGSALTVLNPGTIVPQCYQNSADVLMTFESDYDSYYQQNTANPALNYKDLGWTPASPSKIWHIIYNTPPDQVARVAQTARERGAGYVYITDDVLANPYDTLPGPGYWSAETGAVPGGAPAIADGANGTDAAPTAPTGLGVLDPSNLDYTSVKLTWAPSAGGAYRYRVYVNDKHVASVPGWMNRTTIGGLDPGTTHQVSVSAESNQWGAESAKSNTVPATTLALPHGVPIENVHANLSAASATYTADFLTPYSFRRLYVLRAPSDTTTPCYWTWYKDTEFVCSVYMLENDRFFSYAGDATGTAWSWAQITTVSPVVNKYTYSWTVLLGNTPTPAAKRDYYMIQGEGYGPACNVIPTTS